MPLNDDIYLTDEQRRQRRELGDALLSGTLDNRGPRVNSGPTPNEQAEQQWNATPMKQYMDDVASGTYEGGPTSWMDSQISGGAMQKRPLVAGGGKAMTRDYSEQTAIRDRMRNEAHERMQANKQGLEEREAARSASYYQGNYGSPYGSGNVNNASPFNPVSPGQAAIGDWYSNMMQHSQPRGYWRPPTADEQIAREKIAANERMNRDDNATILRREQMRPASMNRADSNEMTKLQSEIAALEKEARKGEEMIQRDDAERDRREKTASNKFHQWTNRLWRGEDESDLRDVGPDGKTVAGSYEKGLKMNESNRANLAELHEEIDQKKKRLAELQRAHSGVQP